MNLFVSLIASNGHNNVLEYFFFSTLMTFQRCFSLVTLHCLKNKTYIQLFTYFTDYGTPYREI